MATNNINFSGLASNIQWGDIVDSTMKAFEARLVTPITERITARDKQKEQWTKLNGLVDTLSVASRNLRKAGFSGFTTNVPPSPSTGRSLFSATAASTATPGKYRVEVVQLADTAKISGGSVADTGAAMGLAGTFTLNGATITVANTDTLRDIQFKINDANVGGATGVTASIVSDGGTAGRLVLTRDTAGSNGISLTDGTGGIARELGFQDSRSKPITTATIAAATALGLNVSPPPATIRIGGRTITVDLSVDSIASIATRINAAGGSASVESEAFGDQTRFRLVVDGNVTADPGDTNSQAVLDALGMQAGTFGAVRQTVQTGTFTDAGSATATTATALAGLRLDGQSANLNVGDAINIRGLRGDGTAVTIGLVVGASDTVQTLLNRINDATTGFGSGTRPATASLGPDGRIRLTDGTGGASRLSMSMNITRADGSTGTLGATTVSVSGRPRELQTGRDAIVRVDGRDVVRSSNTITDALPGVTMNLLTAEPGTAVDLTIERDLKGGADAMQKFVDAYNAVRTFFDENRQVGAPLYADSLLRTTVDSFTAALRTEVASNTAYGRLATTGVVLDRFGKLTFNAETFKEALAAKPAEIEALLGFSGVGSAMLAATDRATAFGTGLISNQIKTITSNVTVLKKKEADAKARLEERRERLVQQYTRMEEAMARAQSQSTVLSNSIKGLQSN